jgi:hypothetical protein
MYGTPRSLWEAGNGGGGVGGPGAVDEPNEEAALAVLRKAPSARSMNDLNVLLRWLPSLRVKVFEELSEDALRSLCSKVQFETMDARAVVFRQGDPSARLYVILRGSVSVWVNDEQRTLDAVQAEAAAAHDGTDSPNASAKLPKQSSKDSPAPVPAAAVAAAPVQRPPASPMAGPAKDPSAEGGPSPSPHPPVRSGLATDVQSPPIFTSCAVVCCCAVWCVAGGRCAARRVLCQARERIGESQIRALPLHRRPCKL